MFITIYLKHNSELQRSSTIMLSSYQKSILENMNSAQLIVLRLITSRTVRNIASVDLIYNCFFLIDFHRQLICPHKNLHALKSRYTRKM